MFRGENRNAKPDFLIIGAARSGTSWLARNLREHPDIFMPKKKELHFFDRNFDRGYEWYESHFHGNKAVKGEATPAYMYFDGIAEKVRRYHASVKLIAILRNPLDRAISHYMNLLAKNPSLPPFSRKIEETPRLLSEGLYSERLKPYLDTFPRQQVLVLFFEQVQRNPSHVLAETCSFLGVDKSYRFSLASNRINAASHKLSRTHWLKRLNRALLAARAGPLAKRVEPHLASLQVKLSKEQRTVLLENYFLSDINKLEVMLDVSLSHWKR